jgi:hypothetical protein
VTEFQTTVDEYQPLIRYQVAEYPRHEFIEVSENLDELVQRIAEVAIVQDGQLELVTIPCCIQQPFFSHKLTNIQLITEDDRVFLFVWAHGANWKEEFNEKLEEVCTRMNIRYLRRV